MCCQRGRENCISEYHLKVPERVPDKKVKDKERIIPEECEYEGARASARNSVQERERERECNYRSIQKEPLPAILVGPTRKRVVVGRVHKHLGEGGEKKSMSESTVQSPC